MSSCLLLSFALAAPVATAAGAPMPPVGGSPSREHSTTAAAKPTAAAAKPIVAPLPVEPTAAAAEPTVAPLPADLQAAMIGVSWHEGCPVPLADLRLVTVPYIDEAGVERRGQLVVHQDQAEALASVFSTLYARRFAVHRIEPACLHGGSDAALMAANITSAFNCRPVTGGRGWSEHSYGRAVDLNPLWNPYVRGDRVLPSSGRPFVERDPDRPGTTVAGGPAVSAFAAIGWSWGGSWRFARDYQHFSASGR